MVPATFAGVPVRPAALAHGSGFYAEMCRILGWGGEITNKTGGDLIVVGNVCIECGNLKFEMFTPALLGDHVTTADSEMWDADCVVVVNGDHYDTFKIANDTALGVDFHERRFEFWIQPDVPFISAGFAPISATLTEPGDSLLSRARRKVTNDIPNALSNYPDWPNNPDPNVVAFCQALERWKANIEAAIALMEHPRSPYGEDFTDWASEPTPGP